MENYFSWILFLHVCLEEKDWLHAPEYQPETLMSLPGNSYLLNAEWEPEANNKIQKQVHGYEDRKEFYMSPAS